MKVIELSKYMSIISLCSVVTGIFGCDTTVISQDTDSFKSTSIVDSVSELPKNKEGHSFTVEINGNQATMECDYKHSISTQSSASNVPILAKQMNEVSHKQYEILLERSNEKKITVKVDSSIPIFGTDDWRPSIKEAIEEWNNVIGTTVFFEYKTSGASDITIRSDDGDYNKLGDGAAASATAPSSDGTVSSTLRINLNVLDDISLPNDFKKSIIMHELGHSVGLSHTDLSASYNKHIRGTLTVEKESIMNSKLAWEFAHDGSIVLDYSGFSKGDIDAIRLLYPNHSAALVWNSDRVYFFKGNTYSGYSMSADKITESSKSILYNWPGLNEKFATIDAAIQSPWSSNHVYFFSGDEYIKYKKSPKGVSYGPKKIKDHWGGLDFKSINAVIKSPWNSNYLYFFSGEKYYKYSVSNDAVTTSSPKNIDGNWTNLEFDQIDMGFVSPTNANKIYFFHNTQYSRYQASPEQEDAYYPKDIDGHWTGL